VLDYLSLIHKYIPADSDVYKYYIVHVTLVTQKSITIAKNLGLSDQQIEFIEEAAMLHDIGIPKVSAPKLGCHGDKPYLQHMTIGKEILLKEGLPKHAEVAEKHTTITKEQIIKLKLPLDPKDMFPTFLEGEIIAYSDMFFTKYPELLWREKSYEEVIKTCETEYGGGTTTEIFKKWHKKFSN